MSTTPMGEQEQSPSAPNAGTNTSGVPACLATILGQPRAVAGFCEGQLVLADGTCFNVEFCQQKHLHPPIPEAELVKRRLVLVSEIQKTGHGGLAIQFPLGTGDEDAPAAPDLERQRKERKADVEFALLRNGGANGVAALAWFSGMQRSDLTVENTFESWNEVEIHSWPPILLSEFAVGSPTPRSLDFLRQATAVPVNCAALEQVLKSGLGEMKLLTATVQAIQQQHIEKLDQVLADTATLKGMAGEQAAARDEWHKNPLGCPEAITEFMLAMDATGITGKRAMALMWYGCGKTARECAKDAGVSRDSTKRDLDKARQTPYMPFLTGTSKQRRGARQQLKSPDESFALARRLSEKERAELMEFVKRVNTGPRPTEDDASEAGAQWNKATEKLL
jgi:hypothetical protein